MAVGSRLAREATHAGVVCSLKCTAWHGVSILAPDSLKHWRAFHYTCTLLGHGCLSSIAQRMVQCHTRHMHAMACAVCVSVRPASVPTLQPCRGPFAVSYAVLAWAGYCLYMHYKSVRKKQ